MDTPSGIISVFMGKRGSRCGGVKFESQRAKAKSETGKWRSDGKVYDAEVPRYNFMITRISCYREIAKYSFGSGFIFSSTDGSHDDVKLLG